MEKIELTKLFKDASVQTNLRRATFDRLNIKPSTNYRGRTQDEVYFQKQDGAIVEYEITRRMDFEPEGVFEIIVSYTIRRTLADEYVNADVDFREQLKHLEVKDFNFLCGNVFSLMSLIISQLTQASNGIPMVSPPVYCGIAAKSEE